MLKFKQKESFKKKHIEYYFSENEVDWPEILENPVEENIDELVKDVNPLPPWPIFINQNKAKVSSYIVLLITQGGRGHWGYTSPQSFIITFSFSFA